MVGGQARSFHYDGFTFDFGLHAFVSGNERLRALVAEILGDELESFYPRAASRLDGGAVVEDSSQWRLRGERRHFYDLWPDREEVGWNCMAVKPASPSPLSEFRRLRKPLRAHGRAPGAARRPAAALDAGGSGSLRDPRGQSRSRRAERAPRPDRGLLLDRRGARLLSPGARRAASPAVRSPCTIFKSAVEPRCCRTIGSVFTTSTIPCCRSWPTSPRSLARATPPQAITASARWCRFPPSKVSTRRLEARVGLVPRARPEDFASLGPEATSSGPACSRDADVVGVRTELLPLPAAETRRGVGPAASRASPISGTATIARSTIRGKAAFPCRWPRPWERPTLGPRRHVENLADRDQPMGLSEPCGSAPAQLDDAGRGIGRVRFLRADGFRRGPSRAGDRPPHRRGPSGSRRLFLLRMERGQDPRGRARAQGRVARDADRPRRPRGRGDGRAPARALPRRGFRGERRRRGLLPGAPAQSRPRRPSAVVGAGAFLPRGRGDTAHGRRAADLPRRLSRGLLRRSRRPESRAEPA